jgi:hypothetical protein
MPRSRTKSSPPTRWPGAAPAHDLRNHTLSIAAALLFFCSFFAQSLTGHLVYNQQQKDHGGAPVGYVRYLTTGHFVEATFENWESEFLQMGVFVFLTAILVQKGSAESKKPKSEGGAREKDDPEAYRNDPDAPWPVRKGGWILKIYENSLSLAFFILFLITFVLHAMGGAVEYNQEQLAHGGTTVSMVAFMATSQFWFESFQNWQSEFLSVLAMVVLSIFLRQKDSPESKPVEKPHRATGSD